MTAVAGNSSPRQILPDALRRIPLAPAEGWFTLGFVVLMSATVAWSLDDAAWVLGNRKWGDFFFWAAVLATLTGFVAAKARWPRWLSHLGGALVAALVLPVMVGSVLAGEDATVGTMYRATADAAFNAWRDLAILGRASTTQSGHYLLALGIIVWSVGQFAAYAVFGHRRPLDAVIVVGIVLLGNMALTVNDQLTYLVIFSVAALCVLARSHAFDEETTWIRRRMGETGDVRSIYLRGGALFITVAVFGSLVLTASASSAPLAGAWTGFDRVLIDLGRSLQRFLPFGGAPRPVGFGFGNQAQITGHWVSDNRLAVTIRVPPGHKERYYWRAVAFDRFDLNSWAWTDPESVERQAGAPIFATLADEPTDVYARRDVTFTVEIAGPLGDFVLSPLDPTTVNAPATVQIVGAGGRFSAIQVDNPTYTVTAAVPVLGNANKGLTANRLKSAGQDYPDDIRALYLPLPVDALGPNARRLLQQAQADFGSNPYDLAFGIEQRLRNSPDFRYDDDVRGLCGNLSTVECFATIRRGYCLYYASTMAVLLREAGIPARLAEGFLPGQRNEETGVELIPASAAHAWVEVYFPSFGWYAFDPTGGSLPGQIDEPLAEGPPVTPAPSAAPSTNSPRPSVPEIDDDTPGGANRSAGQGSSRDGNATILVALAVLLLVGVTALAFIAWQRGPRGEVTAEGVWRGVGRTAARFGFGPRPQQTVYEYAGALGDILPGNRPELETVARAKVEVAYGRQELGTDARRTLRDAQRRLRLGLLRLALRRKDRRRRRG